jgi:hypothetical protein
MKIIKLHLSQITEVMNQHHYKTSKRESPYFNKDDHSVSRIVEKNLSYFVPKFLG